MHTPPQLETSSCHKTSSLRRNPPRCCTRTSDLLQQLCRNIPGNVSISLRWGTRVVYPRFYLPTMKDLFCVTLFILCLLLLYMVIASYIYRSSCCFCNPSSPSSPRGVSRRKGHPAKNSWRTSMSALFYFAREWETAHHLDPTLARSTDTYSSVRGKHRLW